MIVVVMGVAGAGKTTVGRILAHDLGWQFHDADDHHSAENVAKMAGGTALTERDREPWLSDLQALVRKIDERGESAVLACSALTEAFRSRLSAAASDLVYVYLRATAEQLSTRLEIRSSHFMRVTMLESQLRTLEEPADAIVIDAGSDDAAAVAAKIRDALQI